MNVIRYQPASVIRHFHDQVSRLTQDDYGSLGEDRAAAQDQARASVKPQLARRSWAPAVDVKEEDERYVITADVPGIEPKDIEITMEAGILAIKGSRRVESEQDATAYTRTERAHGEFDRRFSLPKGADADGIVASSSHGVLSVSIPKKPEPQPRRIEIQ